MNICKPKTQCWVAYYINEHNIVCFVGLWEREFSARGDILKMCSDAVFERLSDNCYGFTFEGYSALLVCHNVY